MQTRPQGASDPGPPKGLAAGRGERTALGLLCAAVLVYWAFQFQPFVLPNNDYHSFERAAESFAAFELPSSFKRMPVLPLLMAGLAPLLPEPHPYLKAALIWNQLFSLGVLVGLFALGQRSFGRAGLLLPVLFAATTQFHANGLQPLVEPSLGFFVVWAFVLQERGSPWQYAAAFGAALSRYEAALVIPVLWLAEVVRERRLWWPVAKAALASSGLLLWAGLGALQGSGGSSYLDLMSGMGFQPAPGFFERSLKEPFSGWYTSSWLWLVPFSIVVVLPFAAGLRRSWQRNRELTLSLLGFGVGCVVVIVIFGINKARYVYPTEWIWLTFWLGGALQLGGWLAGEVARRLRDKTWAIALLACGVAGLALAFWLRKMAGVEQTAPMALELAFLASLLGFAAFALWPDAGEGRATRSLRAAVLLVALVPLLAGGLVGKQRAVHKIYYANWSAHLLAGWLDQNLRPDERVALLPRSHLQHLTELDPRRLVSYAQLEASDLPTLTAELDRRGVAVAVFTDRGPLRNPSHHHYYREKKTYLAELFESGGQVPGFEHVATLELPGHIDRKPVQIYRRLAADS